jgi:radical SAM protein with 4Fe4S-binding SPASM domain
MRDEIRIEVTNACNAKCIMCPREKMTRKIGVMNNALFFKIIDECEELKIKNLSLEHFGEPFLDTTLKDKVLYAKNKKMSVMTITNGSLLNQHIDTAKLFDKIRISLIGNESTHKHIQLNLNYKDIVDGIVLLKKQNCRPIIEMTNVVINQSTDDIKRWIDKWEPIVDKVSVWKPHNWIDGRSYRTLNDADLKTCGRPKNGPIQIQWNGDVVPCTFDFDSKLIMGNVINDTIKNILENDLYKKLISCHDRGKFPEICMKCDQIRKKEDVCIYSSDGNYSTDKTNTFKSKI